MGRGRLHNPLMSEPLLLLGKVRPECTAEPINRETAKEEVSDAVGARLDD